MPSHAKGAERAARACAACKINDLSSLEYSIDQFVRLVVLFACKLTRLGCCLCLNERTRFLAIARRMASLRLFINRACNHDDDDNFYWPIILRSNLFAAWLVFLFPS